MLKLRSSLLAFPLALLATFGAGGALADPALLVSPTRVVFEGNSRSIALTLLNNGTDTGTYRLFLVHYRMREDGSFEEVKTPDDAEQQADKMIVFTPKTVTLPPKQAQVVRVALRKPANLAAGEYRTHLLFRVLPTVPAAEPGQGKGISIRLVPAVGVSIPLIIRQGALTASAAVADIGAIKVNGHPGVSFRLDRSGTASIYGNVVVSFTPNGGEAREVARANGLAVYPPLLDRRVALPTEQALAHGKLSVDFQEPEANGKTLAHGEVTLP